MDVFDKKFEVQGTEQMYDVRFTSDGEHVKAHCTCLAGAHQTLCKHILQCINDDVEIRYALTACGYLQVYEEYVERLKYAEQLSREIKKEAKGLKKKFERLLLE